MENYNEAPFEMPPVRLPFNPKAMMSGRGWQPGEGGSVLKLEAYIDGSTGFRHGGTHCGVAVYWMGHYWGNCIGKMGPNYVEMESLRCLNNLVRVRPLTIYTDSSYVQKHGITDRDTRIVWKARCSSPEMRLVDTLAKLCACSGLNFCGENVKDIVSFERELDAKLMAIYDRHYGKGGPCDQSVSSLARRS